MTTTQLVTAAQAAAILSTSPRTVQRLAALGTLPRVDKLPGRTGAYLFDRGTVERVAAELADIRAMSAR